VSDASRLSEQSFFLFGDWIIKAVGNWIFWIIAARMYSAAEIGAATISINTVSTLVGIGALGLEYTLLAETLAGKAKVIGSLTIFSLVSQAALIPVLWIITSSSDTAVQALFWITIPLLIATSVNFISQHAMLGILKAKKVMIVDAVSVGLKFIILLLSFYLHYEAIGIILAALIQFSFTAIVSSALLIKGTGFIVGSIRYTIKLVLSGLSNFPLRVAEIVMINFNSVVLSLMGIAIAELGAFYIAIMITIVAGSFAGSIATMAIPTSKSSNRDMSEYSLRYGLIITTPFLGGIISGPRQVLSLINPSFENVWLSLVILAVAVIPTIVITNAISKFNMIGDRKRLVTLGLVELGVFVVALFTLVNFFGLLAGALAILAGYTAGMVYSARFFSKGVWINILKTLLALTAGVGTGYFLASLALNIFLPIVSSVFVTIACIFLFRAIYPDEIKHAIRSLITKRDL